jgi:DNA-binding GntR family transcriptional regulator
MAKLDRDAFMTEKPNQSQYPSLTRQAHQSLADIAYNALVKAIVNQDFEPGAQLSIDGLARQLTMSNTPVREALMRANGERLVRQKTNHGFVVAALLTPKELHQLFQLRHVLEVHALSSASLPNMAISDIEKIVDQMAHSSDGAVYDDYKEFLVLDHDFHRALVGLAENAFVTKAWEDLHVHLHLSRLYRGVGLIDRSDSAVEHRAILKALKESDREDAVSLLSHHIRRVENRIGNFLEG